MSRPKALMSGGKRFGALHGVRLGTAAITLAVALIGPAGIDLPLRPVILLTAAFLLVTTAAEAVRRLIDHPARTLGRGLLLIDGAYIAAVLALSGGPESRLAFLAVGHIVAVTLLTSSRTGLKIALWQSLLLIVGYYLRLGGLLGLDPQVGPSAEAAALLIVAFWAVAVMTSACSALNERELRRGQAEFRALADMATALEQVRKPERVAALLLQRTVERLGFSRGALLQRTATGPDRALVLEAGAGEPSTATLAADQRSGASPLGTRLVARIEDAGDEVLSTLLAGARNVVVLPLMVEGDEGALLALEWGGRRGTRIPSRTVALLGQFVAHAALALRNTRLLQQVERLASVDPLTGLFNRRALSEALERELARSERSCTPLSVVLLDVDHFKKVNDVHGHQMGDAVLRHAGQALAKLGRAMDVSARYGGEEFIVLLPDCQAADALEVAERVRTGMSKGSPLPITASAGVATAPTCAADAESLIAAADAALYAAKRGGRDRTVVAPAATDACHRDGAPHGPRNQAQAVA